MTRALTISALCFLLSAFAQGAELRTWTLIWNAPDTVPPVREYQVGVGRVSGVYTDFTNVVSTNPAIACEVLIPSDVFSFAAMRSVTPDGVSDWCDEVTWNPKLPTPVLTLDGVKSVILTATSAPPVAVSFGPVPCIAFENIFQDPDTGLRTTEIKYVEQGRSGLFFTRAWKSTNTPSPTVAVTLAPEVRAKTATGAKAAKVKKTSPPSLPSPTSRELPRYQPSKGAALTPRPR